MALSGTLKRLGREVDAEEEREVFCVAPRLDARPLVQLATLPEVCPAAATLRRVGAHPRLAP